MLLNQDTAPALIPERKVSPALQRMLDGMPSRPAYIRTARWDVIAWNKAAARMFSATAAARKSATWWRVMFIDAGVPRHGAELGGRRADFAGEVPQRLCARYRGDPLMDALVSEMQQRSPEFLRLQAAP